MEISDQVLQFKASCKGGARGRIDPLILEKYLIAPIDFEKFMTLSPPNFNLLWKPCN